jgi:diacylglycerol kinase (ATP)
MNCWNQVVARHTETHRGGEDFFPEPLGAYRGRVFMSQSQRNENKPPRLCHVVVNATAGRAHCDRLALALQSLPSWATRLHTPSSVGEMCHLIRTLPKTEDFVLAGGDGTLQCALPDLVRTQRPVAILPLGTANDFASHWGFTADVLSLHACLTQRIVREVDVIQCNSERFLTVGGLGVGAFLTRDFNAARRISPAIKRATEKMGTHIYPVLAGTTIVARRSYLRHYDIEHADGVVSGHFSNVFICNQPQLGGELLVAPKARTRDGLVDILILKALSRYDLLDSLLSLRLKQEPRLSERLSVQELYIKCREGRGHLVFADGEAFEMSPTLHIKVEKSALRILTSGGSAA